MKSLLVIGAGGHARPVISTAKLTGLWKICGVLDTTFHGQPELILEVPVLGGLEKLSKFSSTDVCVIIAIGDNFQRGKIFDVVKKRKFDLTNVTHPSAIIDPTAKLGYGNYIGAFAHIGPETIIGDGNIINTFTNIDHEVKIGNYNQIAPSAVVCGRSFIGNHAFVGASATILDNLSIADRTTIGAGSVIVKKIVEPGKTFLGIPGKEI